jgi:hypothetical protein
MNAVTPPGRYGLDQQQMAYNLAKANAGRLAAQIKKNRNNNAKATRLRQSENKLRTLQRQQKQF